MPNAPRVAILGHALWQRRFGGDAGIVGRTVPLGGEAHTIVGVLPRGFVPAILPDAQIFRPLRLNLATPSRGAVILRVVARLRDGLTLEEARARAGVLAQQLEAAHPRTNHRARIALVALRDDVAGPVRAALFVLLGAAALVLLIACANVANLSLARGLGRARELAVRAALGATRPQIVAELMTESALVAVAGSLLGALLASWGIDALTAVAPAGIALAPGGLGSPLTLASIASAFAILTTVLFGLVPALRASDDRDARALREGARSTGAAGRWVRGGLVIGEIALATLLLAGAGLLLRSLLTLRAFDLGFDPTGTVAGRIVPAPGDYRTPEELAALYDRVLERASAAPGVETAALISILPFGGDNDTSFEIEGRPLPERDDEVPVAWYRLVSADHLRVMGIPLLRGRTFEPTEPAPVIVVNETMARRYWPGEDAVGRRIRPDRDSPWFTIVGVARDMRSRGAAERPIAEMYVPYRFLPGRGMWVVVRGPAGAGGSGASTAALHAAVRTAVREADARLPVANLASLEAMLGEARAQQRLLAQLTGTFSLLALLLAAAGIYGVLAHAVARRTAEIGVRFALGARRRDVYGLIVGDALRLGIAGLGLGLAGALAGARGLRAVLFDTSPADPLTFGLTLGLLLAVTLAAAYLPARRASRIDPATALRA